MIRTLLASTAIVTLLTAGAFAQECLAGLHGALDIGAITVDLRYDDGTRHADGGALRPRSP